MKVSIVCLTYNHQSYINEALLSFVNQKTNFDYEVIIHDDASTDGTTQIIKSYEKKYPDIIKPIYQTENQWRKRKTLSKTFVYPKIKGEYVVFCEGDDFFVDMDKLQKQVDFLDKNKDFTICFHPVIIKTDGADVNYELFPPSSIREASESLDLQTLLKSNFIQTNSCMYRWRFHTDDINTLMPDNIIPGDHFLHLLHAEIGKIGYLPDIMSVYRRHTHGVWAGVGTEPSWYVKFGLLHINFYVEVEKRFNYSQEVNIQNMANNLLLSSILLKANYRIDEFLKKYPQLFEKALQRIQNIYDDVDL